MPNRPRRSKRGDTYQDAVAEVARSVFPRASVDVGKWIDGPDGRRDLDVIVRPKSTDFSSGMVIECKDWNKPIGIGLIDALESKRRDLGMVAMICSNSGFTADALKKAARVGIPALSALIEGDNRIKVVVREQIFTRLVKFQYHRPIFHHQQLSSDETTAIAGTSTNECTCFGKNIESWVSLQLLRITTDAIRGQTIKAVLSFRNPIPIICRKVVRQVTRIEIEMKYEVQWMTQIAEISASKAMYDYLRKIVVAGPGYHQVHWKNLNTETWGSPVSIEDVPPHYLRRRNGQEGLTVPHAGISLAMLMNMPTSDPKDAPDLDALHVAPEILEIANG